jgi:hypothetical protein
MVDRHYVTLLPPTLGVKWWSIETMSTMTASDSSTFSDTIYQPLQRCLKESHGGVDISAAIRPDAESAIELNADDPILCRACSHEVTSVAAMIAIQGSHNHRFTNPAGVTYRIRCFSAADGCLVWGQPTLEFTWFQGFAWSFAFCRRCYLHLGWHYQSSGPSFFGLIRENLIENIRTH